MAVDAVAAVEQSAHVGARFRPEGPPSSDRRHDKILA